MSTESEVRAAATALADWWAQWLTQTAPQDNGDESSAGGVAAAMMMLIGHQSRTTADQAIAFRDALVELVLAEREQFKGELLVATDYGPDHLLTLAAQQAGFKLGSMALPIKSFTSMSRPGMPLVVRVRQGYSGNIRQLWPAPAGDE